MTTDFGVARVWMRDHTSAGVEGVAVEQLVHAYRHSGGRPWLKIRTAEAIVGGVLGSIEDSEALILGRPDPDGRLRVAGHRTPIVAVLGAREAEFSQLVSRDCICFTWRCCPAAS